MLTSPVLRTLRILLPVAGVAVGLALAGAAGAQSKKDFAVAAYKYGFKVDGKGAEIHVQQDDFVRITFSTEDIPHSFTIEDETYGIMRRAEPGRPVTFEFRADKPGRFPVKCTLKADDRCKEMQGWLVVEPRRQPRYQ